MRNKTNRVISRTKEWTEISIATPKFPDLKMIIDTDDYKRIRKMSSSRITPKKGSKENSEIYARMRIYGCVVLVHKLIINVTDPTLDVYHISGNKLDNRKSNLRVCTRGENSRKKKKPFQYTVIGTEAKVEVASQTVIVDAEDLCLLDGRSITVGKNGYVTVGASHKETTKSTIQLSRIIMDAPQDKEVDHISGDKLDNRKANLRLCTHSENMWNRKRQSISGQPYKGVFVRKDKQSKRKWRARIWVNGKSHSVGYFLTPEEAATAYNTMAVKYFGEFARLNKIEDLTDKKQPSL